jgi:signal peptidase I
MTLSPLWLEEVAWNEEGLIPVIAQEIHTGLVLMLALMILGHCVPAADAWRAASRTRASGRPARYRRARVYVAVASLSLMATEAVTAAIRAHVVRAFKIPSRAMWPTLEMGDHILVDFLAYRRRAPARYEVVVFRPPGGAEGHYIKRVIARPGETVEVRNKRVYVNGEALREPYVYFADGPAGEVPKRDRLPPTLVPDGEYWLLGDNRDVGEDSRHWGAVPQTAILGVARSIYWSPDARTGRLRWERMGKPVR